MLQLLFNIELNISFYLRGSSYSRLVLVEAGNLGNGNEAGNLGTPVRPSLSGLLSLSFSLSLSLQELRETERDK